MGAVYAAEDAATSRGVAVKVLHPHLARDERIVERFRREARAASAAGSPHIVEVLELGELEDGTHYLVMELLEGRDLRALLEAEGPLPVGRAVRIARQIAAGLAAAHDKGIVHRDLKPENVFLLDGDERVKVLDFGVSKLLAAIDGAPQPSATRTGTTLGTPHYMAPEQAQAHKDIDHRVDVYALGVILFRALTGQHPFDDESFPVLVVKIITDPPPPLRRWRGDVPKELEQVVERMLAKDRDARFASMDEVSEALAPFADIDVEPWILDAPSTRENEARVLAEDRTVAAARAQTQPLAVPEEDGEPVEPPAAAKPMPPWFFGLGALLLAGAVVGAATTMLEDEPARTEPALPALPVPREPRSSPMVPTSGDGYGWTWVNPQPRAMPTWYAIDVASGGDPVVLVGRGGMAVRYERASLFRWQTGVESDLRGVAWTGAREALAAGDGGVLVRLGPDGPSALSSGTTVTLRDVVAVSATEALVCGDEGTLLRVAGDRVTAIESSTEADLLGMFARGEDVFLVGSEGTILRLRGSRLVREPSPVDVTLRSVGGCPSGPVYAAGDEGTLLWRRTSGAWEQVRVNGNEAFTSVSCDHGRVAAVRRDGSILLVSGARAVELPSGHDGPWYAVAGGTRGPSWIAGAGGRLATIEEDHVRTRTAGPTVPIRDLGGMGGALVAVGEWGRILRERERRIEQVESPTDSGLAALVQVDEGRLIAVGDYGAMVDIRFDRATLLPTPTRASLRDGVSEGNELLVVGAEGTLLRGVPGLLRASVVPGVGDLWSVAGTPADAVAVGEGGVVLRITHDSVSRIDCEGSRTLRAVVRTAEGTWAAGDGGRIVRIEPGGCVEEHEGGPALHAIGVGHEGHLLAAGDAGTVLSRGANGSWDRVDVDVGGASIRAIWRSSRYVYLAGTEGVLVRHIRLDR